ncbi:MAG: LUD domain-containing protein [Alphaproteobacteria bacterium]
MSASNRGDGLENGARETVLARMKAALDRGDDATAKETVRARLSASAPTLVPARADLAPEGRLQLFIERAQAVQAQVERIDTIAELPATIATYLRRHNLPMRLVRAADDQLERADWTNGLLEVRSGRPEPEDAVGLTRAFAGIAETGTVMLASDAGHPMTLAFLPETAVIVLSSDRIARAYEDVMHAFRASVRSMPRSINLVTGPSRSGDIEQTLQLGAHGPKRLLLVLVDEPSAEGPIAHVGVPKTHT